MTWACECLLSVGRSKSAGTVEGGQVGEAGALAI